MNDDFEEPTSKEKSIGFFASARHAPVPARSVAYSRFE
jgi:hypothetical protein